MHASFSLRFFHFVVCFDMLFDKYYYEYMFLLYLYMKISSSVFIVFWIISYYIILYTMDKQAIAI